MMNKYRDATDAVLFVRDSSDDVTQWQRRRIIDTLVIETDLDADVAEAIALDVEKQIVAADVTFLTSTLVRELVDAKLVEKGFLQARKKHARIGLPLYDVRNLITSANKGNANVPLSPEGTNLAIAESVKRDFALSDVFSSAVADSHASGDIHLHGLGYIDRLYNARLSLLPLQKQGLNFPHSLVSAAPAKHAETLVLHMVRFSVAMQGILGGHLAWEALNIFFAPYLVGLDEANIKQTAQMLVYEFSQLASARGGQSIFCDIILYWNIPACFEKQRVILPGGGEGSTTYGAYKKEARRFFLAIFEVLREGDAFGKPFSFPCPIVKVDAEFLNSNEPETSQALSLISDVASAMGNTVFNLVRANTKENLFAFPFGHSFVAHNVSLNMPRLALSSTLDNSDVFRLLEERLALIGKAHRQKYDFLQSLLENGNDSPLALLGTHEKNSSLFDLNKAIFSIGFVGLAEFVLLLTSEEMHNSAKAQRFAEKTLTRLRRGIAECGKEHNMNVKLVHSHAETTAHRFARLDLARFSPASGRLVRGDISSGSVYYSNSSQIYVGAEISPLTRALLEGNLQHRDDLEATSQIHLAAGFTATDRVVCFLKEVFAKTRCLQILFSPEFAFCPRCGRLLPPAATFCESCEKIARDINARITRYYSPLSAWNRGKQAEFLERKRHNDYFTQSQGN